jgi:uncharacterized Ntn-hydrolase superfamily protein
VTYSIVVRDAETSCFGVAVQSHYFAVGRIVPWAEAGVGAVATQSFADPSYGPLGLRLMRDGLSAPEALSELVARDERRDVRQVAMVDAHGNAAAHTGSRCVSAAGDIQGASLTAQANMMTRATVWTAMRDTYEGAQGSLAERLLAALDAAEEEGGDIRGRQSAAILIVGAARTEHPWEAVLLDVRVDDHPEPLDELRRLVRMSDAYDKIGKALSTSDAGADAEEVPEAIGEEALADLASADRVLDTNPEAAMWRAVVLARLGRTDEAREAIRELSRAHPELAEFVRRLPEAGLLPEGTELSSRR